jgi:hypothetical protein
MLIATVPYVGKRLHLDPDPNPELNYGCGSELANNFGSGRIRIHNPDLHTNIKKFAIFQRQFRKSSTRQPN